MKDTIHLGDMSSSSVAEPPMPHPGRKRKKFLWRVVVLVIIIAAIWYAWALVAGRASWRAVFLTNNQVYFGHFWDVPFASAITLSNVYYLQVAQPSEQLAGQTTTEQLKLVRLGNEIHGPTDEMTIPLNQVLFWETLRSDSAVVAAIKTLSQSQ